MKIHSLAPWLAVSMTVMNWSAARAPAATILVDFGTTDYPTASPTNGLYWNNATNSLAGIVLSNLVDTAGTTTAISLSNRSSFAQLGGVGVGLTNPPAALGALAVESATLDAWGSTNIPGGISMDLAGLSPTATYFFRLFGTRADPQTRITEYVIAGATTQSAFLTTSGIDAGGPGYNGNVSNVVTIAGVSADASRKVNLRLKVSAGDLAYLNCLRIDAVEPPPPLETVLVDFGNDDLFRSVSVSSPDPDGQYWNSVSSVHLNLTNTANAGTGIDLGFDTAFAADSYNGPAGEVTNDPPSTTEIASTSFDPIALGALGATNAVMDYFTGIEQKFRLTGLNAGRTYRLSFFGSHKFSTDTGTVYSVYADTNYTVLLASAALNVQEPGMPWLHNSNRVAVLPKLAPQAESGVYVKFTGDQGNQGYLNAMKIEIFDAEDDVTPIEVFTRAGSAVSVSFVGSYAASYTLQYSTNLVPPTEWRSVLTSGVPVSVTGNGVTTNLLADTDLADGFRAYRLIRSP